MSERWLRCLKGFVSTTLSTDTPRSVGESTRWRRNLSEGGKEREGRRGGKGEGRRKKGRMERAEIGEVEKILNI